jgi:hypothetical protein
MGKINSKIPKTNKTAPKTKIKLKISITNKILTQTFFKFYFNKKYI